MLRKDVQECVLDSLEGKNEGLCPGRIDPTASPPNLAPPRPAATPCFSPIRAALCVSGFWIGQWIRQVKTSKHQYTFQPPGTMSGFCPADKLWMNCRSTGGQLDMPCMKRPTKTNRRRYTSQRQGTKSGSRPIDKQRMNRG